MESVNLFLGFPIDPTFDVALQKIDQKILALFINKSSDEYLKEVVYNDCRYIGKIAQKVTNSRSLALLESNIYSILKKLIPNYPCEEVPLVVFPLSYPE